MTAPRIATSAARTHEPNAFAFVVGAEERIEDTGTVPGGTRHRGPFRLSARQRIFTTRVGDVRALILVVPRKRALTRTVFALPTLPDLSFSVAV